MESKSADVLTNVANENENPQESKIQITSIDTLCAKYLDVFTPAQRARFAFIINQMIYMKKIDRAEYDRHLDMMKGYNFIQGLQLPYLRFEIEYDFYQCLDTITSGSTQPVLPLFDQYDKCAYHMSNLLEKSSVETHATAIALDEYLFTHQEELGLDYKDRLATYELLEDMKSCVNNKDKVDLYFDQLAFSVDTTCARIYHANKLVKYLGYDEFMKILDINHKRPQNEKLIRKIILQNEKLIRIINQQ